jgi:hypothetical protein
MLLVFPSDVDLIGRLLAIEMDEQLRCSSQTRFPMSQGDEEGDGQIRTCAGQGN